MNKYSLQESYFTSGKWLCQRNAFV